MLESFFSALCKIGTFFKLSWNKHASPSTRTNATTQTGHAAASSGPNSPIHIGDKIQNYPPNSEIDPKSSFKNRLTAVAHELPHNFRNRGNAKNPFITKALEKLVYDEPMIHGDTELFQKASLCLNTALELSTAQPWHPTLKPGQGQHLMKDLAEYISTRYGIKDSS